MSCTIVGITDPRCIDHGNTVGFRCAKEVTGIIDYAADLQKKLEDAEQNALADADYFLREHEKLLAVVDAAYDLLAEANGNPRGRNTQEEKLWKTLQALDTRHHAPMCPANHYHAMKKPSGPCSCGAVDPDRFACPHCKRICAKEIWTSDAKDGKAFCPYCGDAVALDSVTKS